MKTKANWRVMMGAGMVLWTLGVGCRDQSVQAPAPESSNPPTEASAGMAGMAEGVPVATGAGASAPNGVSGPSTNDGAAALSAMDPALLARYGLRPTQSGGMPDMPP